MEEFASPVGEGERPSRRRRNVKNWARTKQQTARYMAKLPPQYPQCNHAERSIFKCKHLTGQEVTNFYDSFYKHPDRTYQNNFILRFVEVSSVKRRRKRQINNDNNEKNLSRLRTTNYFVRDSNGDKQKVCLNAFSGILQVNRFRINKLTRDYTKHGVVEERRGGARNKEKFEEKKKTIMNFINKLKVIESHYCRSTSCRKYLPSELNVKKLWRMYRLRNPNHPVKQSYFRMVFKKYYNIGFGTPRTDVCSTCLRLGEQIKTEKDEKLKTNLITEKRVHRLQYKAFYDHLKDNDKKTLILSFDCQKNVALPKIPDQSTYYSRQFYFQNFTVVKGYSKGPLNPKTCTSYCWTENLYAKDSNLISSCVLDALLSIDMTPYNKVRLVSDGCGGQNKNSILVAMCHTWLARLSSDSIKQMELIFPITGHSFLPPDRVFGNIEKEIKKREEIIQPEELIDIISKFSLVKRVGVDCDIGDFRTIAKTNFKELKNWHFQISTVRRVIFTKDEVNGCIKTRGETSYRSDIGQDLVLAHNSVDLKRINPDVIEAKNSVSDEKKKDVLKLLVNHFGCSWREREDLKFYKNIIDGANHEQSGDERCEHIEFPPTLLV